MNATLAAKELDAIRDAEIRNRWMEADGINRTDSVESLVSRVDAIGHWAASQKNSKKLFKILAEASDLHAVLTGGLRCDGRTQIVIG